MRVGTDPVSREKIKANPVSRRIFLAHPVSRRMLTLLLYCVFLRFFVFLLRNNTTKMPYSLVGRVSPNLCPSTVQSVMH